MKTRPLNSLFFCLPLIFSVAAFAPHAAAEEKETNLVNDIITGIPHSAYFSLSIEDDRAVAVGVAGTIMQSEDGGQNWAPAEDSGVGFDVALLDADLGGEHAIAVGQIGAVVIEDEPGKWRKVDPGFEGRMLSVSVNRSGLAVIGGEFGTVLKSTDGGETWTSNQPDWEPLSDATTFGTAEPHVYAVHAAENGDVTIAGEFGLMLRQPAGTDEWVVLRGIEAKAPTLFAMHIDESGSGESYAVGLSGEILRSTDAGKEWTRVESSDTDANFLGVTALPNGRVVITGMRVMLVSTDYGRNWLSVNEGDVQVEWYQGVDAHRESGRIYAVGHAGKIIQIGG